MNPNINKFQLVPWLENCEKNQRPDDVDEKLIRFGVIQTQDHGFVKFCKKTPTNSSQDKKLQALNSFNKLGKTSYNHRYIFPHTISDIELNY